MSDQFDGRTREQLLKRHNGTSLWWVVVLSVVAGCAGSEPPANADQSDDDAGGRTGARPRPDTAQIACPIADDRIGNYSRTAEVSKLMQCVRYGHTDAALALIEGGADLTYRTSIRTDAMSWAVEAGDTAVFHALRDRGVPLSPVGAQRMPLLSYPIQQGDLEMVRLLLEAGADPNEPGIGGQPPLSMAAGTGDTAVASLLLAHGADVGVDPRDEFAGGPPLVEATDRVMIDFLLDAGADIDQPEWYHDQTLLWRVVCGRREYGSASERLDLARRLIARGAQVDARDAGAFTGEPDDGQTPLICAVRANDVDMVRLLIDSGANVNATRFGTTLLELGREAGDSTVVRLLQAAGAA